MTKYLSLILASGVAIAGSQAFAQTRTFTVGDGGGKVTQSVVVESVAQFENFTGKTSKVTGTLKIDPAKKTGSGKVVIDLASIDTGIALRNEHMRSEMWLDTAKYPQAVFEATSVKHKRGDVYTVTGKLTFHGVTRAMTTEVTGQYVEASEQTRKAGFRGDVVRLRGAFDLKLADYGVKIPERTRGKVAETVKLSFDIYGYTG
ncbi:MAG: YceI family protein [Fimbriimonadia bacterium]|jgi:polyisoprenoid-binding protein YceI